MPGIFESCSVLAIIYQTGDCETLSIPQIHFRFHASAWKAPES